MGTAERRMAILKLLCKRRSEKLENLASEFDVSVRTIRRDIEALSYDQPIYTMTGRRGGVYVVDEFYMERMYMSDEEIAVLEKIRDLFVHNEGVYLNSKEQRILEDLIKTYKKPVRNKLKQ